MNKNFIFGLMIVLIIILITLFVSELPKVNLFSSSINLPTATTTENLTPTSSIESSSSANNSSTGPVVWGEYHVSLPDGLILVDSQGRRTGKDPITGAYYHEIPGTSYVEIGTPQTNGAGELFTSNLPVGQYTLYVLGGETASYWMDASHYEQQDQAFKGAISKGAMIAYTQNYDTENIASSTFEYEGVVSSTASVTTLPANNLP